MLKIDPNCIHKIPKFRIHNWFIADCIWGMLFILEGYLEWIKIGLFGKQIWSLTPLDLIKCHDMDTQRTRLVSINKLAVSGYRPIKFPVSEAYHRSFLMSFIKKITKFWSQFVSELGGAKLTQTTEYRLRRRKLSLVGVLEQADAEIRIEKVLRYIKK